MTNFDVVWAYANGSGGLDDNLDVMSLRTVAVSGRGTPIWEERLWFSELLGTEPRQALITLTAGPLRWLRRLEIFSQGSLNTYLSIGSVTLTGLLTIGRFLQPCVSTSAFQASELRDSPHQLTSFLTIQYIVLFYCLFVFRIPQYTFPHSKNVLYPIVHA
jgi:hypothetical protein